MENEIRICLLRHGKTPGNIRRGYIGSRTDENLDNAGRQELMEYKKKGYYPDADFLYMSPMKRCRQTAEIVWPDLLLPGHASCMIIQDLRECDFGDFDGKSYSELDGVPDFQHWVDSDGMGSFPGGEDPEDFRKRSADAFLRALLDMKERGLKSAACAVHGGTVMSVLSAFGPAGRSYYDWHVINGDGYEVTVRWDTWDSTHRFSSVRRLLPEEDGSA